MPRKRSDTERGHARSLNRITNEGDKEQEMKRAILCAVTMSAFAAAEVVAAISPYDIETPVGRLVNESLDGFGYSRRNPAVGEIWELPHHP